MKRCIIIGGADISNSEYLRRKLRGDDYAVYCDSGLRHMEKLELDPSLIVGDFDSHKNPELDVETIILPREKDDTDTFFAAKECLKRGFDEFLLVGVMGGRLDHTLANISILINLTEHGKKATIIDDHSEMEMVTDKVVRVDESYKYFSLLNVTGNAKGINVKNAKYPLENARIDCNYQYGVSNEVLPGKVAEISVNEGMMLLIKTYSE